MNQRMPMRNSRVQMSLQRIQPRTAYRCSSPNPKKCGRANIHPDSLLPSHSRKSPHSPSCRTIVRLRFGTRQPGTPAHKSVESRGLATAHLASCCARASCYFPGFANGLVGLAVALDEVSWRCRIARCLAYFRLEGPGLRSNRGVSKHFQRNQRRRKIRRTRSTTSRRRR